LDYVIVVWNILKAALGVGFVIFIHELGHFALAKWNGVKVLQFSIGFGPPIISYRKGVGLRVGTGSRPTTPDDPPGRGETEYQLAYVPLGGYVMMFGENAEESTEQGKAEVAKDPRAYKNKSVWARMQIITAGVIMNVILGLACFTFAYMQGIMEIPARLGGVLPGSPAYKAGLMAGDEIVAIDGRREVSYKDLLNRVGLSAAGQKINFTIKREGAADEKIFAIEPLREGSNQAPTIGVLMAHSIQLNPEIAFQPMPGQTLDAAKPNPGFEPGDKVVAIGPEGGPLEPVKDQIEFDRKSEKLRDRPLVVEVERKKAKDDLSTTLVKVTVPPHHFLELGLRLTPGPIVALRPGSPAEKAGLQVGDRIEKVDGDADYDPMKLPDYAQSHESKTVVLSVLRSVDGKPSRLDVTLTPDASPAWADSSDGRITPLEVPGLGLAMTIEPKIQGIAEDSAAAKAGLKVGETLQSVTLTPSQEVGDEEKTKPKAVTLKLDDKAANWPSVFAKIQENRLDSIELTTDKSSQPIKVVPEVDPNRYHPRRGLVFQSLRRKQAPLGLADAVSRGSEETLENILNIFKMFQGMFQRRIGGDAVGGVIPIGKIAYDAASAGWTPLIQILGSLSVGLAVLNFLPIPPLDGGQFTLLVAEKVRGRPLPEWIQNFVSIGGLVFVLGLILLVNGRDLIKLVTSYF